MPSFNNCSFSIILSSSMSTSPPLSIDLVVAASSSSTANPSGALVLVPGPGAASTYDYGHPTKRRGSLRL